MTEQYKTVYEGGEGEIVEKKSRFIATDIPAIGQRKPGEKVRFSYISVEEAQKLNLERKKYLDTLDKKING